MIDGNLAIASERVYQGPHDHEPASQSELIKALEADRTCFWVPSPKCPRCGSTLVSNGRNVWCSFVGGAGEPACAYGLDTSVTIESL